MLHAFPKAGGMNIIDKITTLFGPLDVVVIERDFETLINKTDEPDIFPECLDYAQEILGVGEYAERNPTCWKTFQGQPIEIGSEEWRQGIANLLRLTSTHKVSELDNERYHLQVGITLEVLVVNAKQLVSSSFNGAKCVSVQTPFGKFPVVEE